MRAAGDVLLVSCYELGRQPLSLAWPAAHLRRAGFAPECIDLAVTPLDDAVLARLARARLVAVAVPMHTALRLGVRVAERVRGAGGRAHLAFFGLYATLNRELLARAGADSVLGGEAEDDLVALADALADGRAAPAGGVTLRRLPLLPPERDGLPPLERYAKLLVHGEADRLVGSLEGTRGCLHMCRHCPIPPVYGGRFFAVAREVVIEDARRQWAAGARHFSFGDPDFLNGPRHALELARELAAALPGVTFDVTVKVEHILAHRAVWPELRQLGCVFVVSAVESLSERVLEILAKGHTRADVRDALAVVRGAGISLRPTFVAFTPWTTLDDYLALCRFVREHALEDEVDPVQLALRLLVPPGSLLVEHPDMRPHLGALDERALTWRWTHPDPRMDDLAARAMALVEHAEKDPPAETFARLESLALGSPVAPVRGPRRTPPPRISEPWFC